MPSTQVNIGFRDLIIKSTLDIFISYYINYVLCIFGPTERLCPQVSIDWIFFLFWCLSYMKRIGKLIKCLLPVILLCQRVKNNQVYRKKKAFCPLNQGWKFALLGLVVENFFFCPRASGVAFIGRYETRINYFPKLSTKKKYTHQAQWIRKPQITWLTLALPRQVIVRKNIFIFI